MTAPNFDVLNRPRSELTTPTGAIHTVKDISPSVGEGNDDTAAIMDAFENMDGIGGGELVFDRPMTLAQDITLTSRKTIPRGVGAHRSILHGAGGQRVFRITGLPADPPGFDGDLQVVHGMTFDGVTLGLGHPTASNLVDTSRGIRVAFCEFVHGDVGLQIEGRYTAAPGGNNKAFAGVGAIFCKFRLLNYGIRFVNAGPSGTVLGCGIDECSEASIWVDGIALDGLSLFVGANTYSDHSKRFMLVNGPKFGDGGLYVTGVGVELCGTSSADTKYPGFSTFIENDGANIFIDQMQGFVGPHTDVAFWNKSGNILVRGGGRWDWPAGKLIRIDSGFFVFDQSNIFAAPRLWGEGSVPFIHASSTGGQVIAPRTGFMGRTNIDFGLASGPTALSAPINIEAYDYNLRIFEFSISTLANGTDNVLRIFMNDGIHDTHLDMTMPLIAGGGRVRIVHTPGGTLHAVLLYNPSSIFTTVPPAVGANPTKFEFDQFAAKFNGTKPYNQTSTIVDNSSVTRQRQFQLQTVSPSGTPSTISIRGLSEQIIGPKVIGL